MILSQLVTVVVVVVPLNFSYYHLLHFVQYCCFYYCFHRRPLSWNERSSKESSVLTHYLDCYLSRSYFSWTAVIYWWKCCFHEHSSIRKGFFRMIQINPLLNHVNYHYFPFEWLLLLLLLLLLYRWHHIPIIKQAENKSHIVKFTNFVFRF